VFSPDASRLATLGVDGSIKLWDISAEPKQQNVGNADGATVIEMTSRNIIVGTASGESLVWRAPFSGAPVRSRRHSAPIRAISTADDRLVATAASDGTVAVWDPETGASIAPAMATEIPIVSAALSADGRWIALAHGATPRDDPSRDLDRATIGLWDVARAKRAGKIGWLGKDVGYFLSESDQIELFGAEAAKSFRCEAEVGGARTIFEFALCEDRFVVPGLLNATLHGDSIGVVE
jgi:WD40 repeat protein